MRTRTRYAARLLAATVLSTALLTAADTTAALAGPCTVTGPVSPTYRDSWAAAYRCQKDGSGNGGLGGYANFVHGTGSSPIEDGDCGGRQAQVDWGFSAAMDNGFVGENDEQLGAFVRPTGCRLIPYWYVRHNGQAVRTFNVQNDCNGSPSFPTLNTSYNTTQGYRGTFAIGVTRQDLGNVSRWQIVFNDEFRGCAAKVTNIEGFGYRSAEQWVHNDHGTIAGDSRHRLRGYGLQWLRADNTYQPWADGTTGINQGGFATAGRVSAADYCTRTGNVGPTCP